MVEYLLLIIIEAQLDAVIEFKVNHSRKVILFPALRYRRVSYLSGLLLTVAQERQYKLQAFLRFYQPVFEEILEELPQQLSELAVIGEQDFLIEVHNQVLCQP